MSISTIQEELTAVNNAIEAILTTGSSYTINGQTVTRANLDSLFERKNYLESRLAAQQRGGYKKRPVFEG